MMSEGRSGMGGGRPGSAVVVGAGLAGLRGARASSGAFDPGIMAGRGELASAGPRNRGRQRRHAHGIAGKGGEGAQAEGASTLDIEHRQGQASPVTGSIRRASAVALYVYDAADVELTASETLRLSRLAYSSNDGYFLERHGDLLQPGTTRLRLMVGVYHFKSAHDVQLRIHQAGAVKVVTPHATPTDTPASTKAAQHDRP